MTLKKKSLVKLENSFSGKITRYDKKIEKIITLRNTEESIKNRHFVFLLPFVGECHVVFFLSAITLSLLKK